MSYNFWTNFRKSGYCVRVCAVHCVRFLRKGTQLLLLLLATALGAMPHCCVRCAELPDSIRKTFFVAYLQSNIKNNNVIVLT